MFRAFTARCGRIYFEIPRVIAPDIPMANKEPDSNVHAESDPNILTYNAPAVVKYYAALNYLTPCEQLLFDAYLKPGTAILDLGVGGGRTTPYLSSLAERYVGFDYASEMIASCRKKFPHLDFEVGNVADLSRFSSSSFDAVVMAFNGMDYVIPDESRFRTLREIGRVLKPEGILIFSSHNPRSIWVRVSWNAQRVRKLAETVVGCDSILFRPLMWSLTAVRVILVGLQAVLQSLGRAARRLPTRAFWQGQGYLIDPVHGGLKTHLAAPVKVARELGRFGFCLLRVLGDDYPRVSRSYVTDWYYYVFSKTGATGEK
jgi:SAM-dependent methyltransferase